MCTEFNIGLLEVYKNFFKNINISETVGIEKIFNQLDDKTKALKQEILPGITVNMGYVGFTRYIVIIVNQSVSFPSERDNYDFTNVRFCGICIPPSL
jgi:hypothetical protein